MNDIDDDLDFYFHAMPSCLVSQFPSSSTATSEAMVIAQLDQDAYDPCQRYKRKCTTVRNKTRLVYGNRIFKKIQVAQLIQMLTSLCTLDFFMQNGDRTIYQELRKETTMFTRNNIHYMKRMVGGWINERLALFDSDQHAMVKKLLKWRHLGVPSMEDTPKEETELKKAPRSRELSPKERIEVDALTLEAIESL
jgi:hypothetical protein